MNAHIQKGKRHHLYQNLKRSLSEIDKGGVELIAQTMPPFPWHFGGQRYHNLFIDPWEIIEFCMETGMRLCLDVSHSKLACNHFNWSFREYLTIIGPHVAHIHIADAKGVDGEGLQLGEGEIDIYELVDVLQDIAPQISFIPEIWQGHKNQGEGFWLAMDRYESSFLKMSQDSGN